MSAEARRKLIIALTLVTALVHLVLLNLGMGTIDLLFTLNGLGFLALLYAYLNDIPAGRKELVRWAFIAYTAVTILAWFLINGDFSSPLGLITKLDELALLALLATDR